MMGYNSENDEVRDIVSTVTHQHKHKDNPMNRKKKLNQIHKKRLKAANEKIGGKKKPIYISKAEREKLEELETTETP
jgi:hypothetical protein